MGLCLFRCLAVGVAFRRDARPRPTGLCHVGAVVFYVLPFRIAEDVCPYGLCLFCCFVIGIAFRRDAEDVVPYGLFHDNTVMNVTLHGGTQGPALRFLPR